VEDLSCPTAAACLAGQYHEVARTTEPLVGNVAWPSVTVDEPGGVGSIDCPSASFCLGGSGGYAVSSRDPLGEGAGWGVTQYIDSYADVTDVDCDPGGAVCIAVDRYGHVLAGVPDPEFVEEEPGGEEPSSSPTPAGVAQGVLSSGAPPAAGKHKLRRHCKAKRGKRGHRKGAATAKRRCTRRR
jgi:hypothetical protein